MPWIYPLSGSAAYHDILRQNGTYAPPLRGDLNSDGIVNLFDLMILREYIITQNVPPEQYEKANINGDGSIDIRDLLAMRNIILGLSVLS